MMKAANRKIPNYDSQGLTRSPSSLDKTRRSDRRVCNAGLPGEPSSSGKFASLPRRETCLRVSKVCHCLGPARNLACSLAWWMLLVALKPSVAQVTKRGRHESNIEIAYKFVK